MQIIMATNKDKPVASVRHKAAQRKRIPSREEAGQEEEILTGQPKVAEYPVNPIAHRGQDPELFWLEKYGKGDAEDRLKVDIRSLYRHEHIAPELIISRLYHMKQREDAQSDLFVNDLFGNTLTMDELDKPLSYYKQADKWQNRLIQGDSLLVMTSLLEREGMAGQVQTIYIDPPYGIKYGGNWQMRLNDRTMPSADPDDALSGEPEVIKAFRDTWELGIHSYLSYLRDRLLVAKELVTTSGSVFVQISDENVHLVRCLMDEVFGSENFIALIAFSKTTGFSGSKLSSVADFLIWYAKDIGSLKYRQLYREKSAGDEGASKYRPVSTISAIPPHIFEPTRLATSDQLTSQGISGTNQEFEFAGKTWLPPKGLHWKTAIQGLRKLAEKNRIIVEGNSIRYVRFLNDFPIYPISNLWTDVGGIQNRSEGKVYVVQTAALAIERCLLMTTDPGDLVLDPTCGSGTTAYVAEQWGRRWITSDTSRIALNIAKTRLMTATYPWYKLADPHGEDIRLGFVYKKVPHVTLKSLANDEPPEEETLFDQPEVDRKKLRVAGPFTVETLQSFEPLAPEAIDEANAEPERVQSFTERVFEHLKSAGIKNGIRNETAVFSRVDLLNDDYLHAEGWYGAADGERKTYFHIGPQFGTVSKAAVNEAIKAARRRGDGDWLVILGFGFESGVENTNVTRKVGSFEVTKVRMHDDLMQEGLIKKDKKAASFVTIGEPDIGLEKSAEGAVVEIRGLDIYDPIRDEVKPRSAADIAYWMVDDDYNGTDFVARQVFFCGGDKDEFDKWKKGLTSLAVASTKRAAEKTLKIELDDEAFSRLYGFRSHPISAGKGKRVAVRVVSQFGEESTKVLSLA
jgi:adenine-specific DNA-methyltransferase